MNWKAAAEEVKRDEGLKLHCYRCTSGIRTIGYGRNLDNCGISEAEADYLFSNDIRRAYGDCLRLIPVFRFLDGSRQSVLVNMMFNLGPSRLMGFKKFLGALDQREFEGAADEMLDSKWATQVGPRATRLARRMRGESE